jgi:PleD family two-component response regulator
MHLRILIVESDPEDLFFIEDALMEIEQGRFWIPWAEVETLTASTCLEAAAILPRESVDIILLNPNLSDGQGVTAFRLVQKLAPHIPVILLMDAADRDLGVRLVREGAQDFMVKKQIDCAPLAHSIRNAIERQRIRVAAQATTMTDPLTGLLNRGAFYTLAERDRRLAERLSRRLLLVVAEPRNLLEPSDAASEQRRELMIVTAGDFLRGLVGSTGMLARIAETRFSLALLDTDSEPIESTWSRIHSEAAQYHMEIGAAIFEPDQPVPLEILLDRAARDLGPRKLASKAAAVRR